MESFKDKIAIIGMGCTKFGERWDTDFYDLVIESAYEAYEDAGIDPKDIQAAWIGTVMGSTATQLSAPLKTNYIPATRVENVCVTGIESLRGASYAVAAKAYDIALAIGCDKHKDTGYGGLPLAVQSGGSEKWHPVFGSGDSAPGRYALAATRYFYRFGLTGEEGKRVLAKISVKSHHNGYLNPRAHLRMEVTEEQVMNAPIIAWPLGLFDACGVTDGAAAAIICRAEDASKYKKDYTTIKAFGLAAGPGMGKVRTDYDYVHWEETQQAAKQAYADAGIQDPRKEIDMCEVHDCFSIAELMCYEDLGFCNKGEAKYDIEAGTFALHGKHPFNVGGGLKSFGHPVGASGIREVYEGYVEILGRAESKERQLPNIETALAHNQGGNPGRFICGICIQGVPGK